MQLSKNLLRLQRELKLDHGSMVRLKHAADNAQRVENRYKKQMAAEIDKLNRKIASLLAKHGRWTAEIQKLADKKLEQIVYEHAYRTMRTGLATAMDGERSTRPKLSKPRKGRMPRNFKDLMSAWRSYNKTGKVPKKYKRFFDRAEDDSNKLKNEYLKKTRGAWERYSKDFRSGEVVTREEIITRIQKASGTTRKHASTIVNTETTYYYNKIRREYYDQSEDVVAYLFVPVRDAATTKWCKTRRNIVYLKDSKYLQKETPPIHWNCRSELLPLTMQNPSHLRLIEDKSLRRENRRPEKLHPKWVA